ncbi:MAG: hypothetical protein GY775_14720 [Candidatus Scalindua sp.]|nr:hypothetical protein [Candidatus Scalindua sp.]
MHELKVIYLTGQVVEQIVHPLTGEKMMELFVVERETAVSTGSMSPTPITQFDSIIGLLEADVAEMDGTITITATWESLAPPTANHTLFVHLHPANDVDSQPLAQLDVQPCFSTTLWQTGDLIRDHYHLALPPELQNTGYAIALGWYTWPTYERLLLESNSSLDGNRYLLQKSGIGE